MGKETRDLVRYNLDKVKKSVRSTRDRNGPETGTTQETGLTGGVSSPDRVKISRVSRVKSTAEDVLLEGLGEEYDPVRGGGFGGTRKGQCQNN